MYINICSIIGRYRGIYRFLSITEINTKKFNKVYSLFEKYWNWEIESNHIYSESIIPLLKSLQDEILLRGQRCEIICYSDYQEEFVLNKEQFLGFDVSGDIGESLLAEDNNIGQCYTNKLNQYGLFTKLEEAKELSDLWGQLINSNTCPWEIEENPRPFCVWLYKN